MSLDTKYRPQQYSDVLGQKGIIEVLRQTVKTGKGLHQSYLFAGPSGIGKTTLGRILARALLCDDPQEGDPCDQCPSCIQILTTGTSDAFMEVDAATNSGKDHIRTVLESSSYATFSGKRRIWLFDESHQLTTGALDGMLLSMEENISGRRDKRLVVILCTTEPDKMRPTVMSRCLNFQVRLGSPRRVARRLDEICQAEGIQASMEVLTLAAELTGCHVRSGIKLVESLSFGEITRERLLAHLQLDKNDQFLTLAENLGTDIGGSLAAAKRLAQALPPRACYERLGEALQNAWIVGQGLGVPSYWPKERLQALHARLGDNLLWMAEGLALRPARLTSSLWSIDVALLHKRLLQPAQIQQKIPALAPKTTEDPPKLQGFPPETPEKPQMGAPKAINPQPFEVNLTSRDPNSPSILPQNAEKKIERDPMEPSMGTISNKGTSSAQKAPEGGKEGNQPPLTLLDIGRLLEHQVRSLAQQSKHGKRSP